MRTTLQKLGFDASRPDRVMVPMRDGVKLETLVYRPGEGAYPVVLTRGYWPGSERDGKFFGSRGYDYAGQSTRGHGKSEGREGVSRRFLDDREDGYDTLEWISRQPWCNGSIAMYGKSYWASTQWSAAVGGHPNPKAIIPQNTNPESFNCGYRTNGVLSLAMTARGRAYDRNDWKAIDRLGWNRYFRHLRSDSVNSKRAESGASNEERLAIGRCLLVQEPLGGEGGATRWPQPAVDCLRSRAAARIPRAGQSSWICDRNRRPTLRSPPSG